MLLIALPHFHEGGVKGGLDHVADLTLGHRSDDFEGHFGNRIAAFLLQKQVAHLGSVAVGDNNLIFFGKFGNLAHGQFEVLKLFLRRSFLTALNQGVAAKGDQHNRFVCHL